MRRKWHLVLVIIGGALLCLFWRHRRVTPKPLRNEPVPTHPIVNFGLNITRLELIYNTGRQFDVDLTLQNDSPFVQSVVLPSEISIENIPGALTPSHASEVEMMPRQESTYNWTAQVDNRAVSIFRRVMADVVSGKKTITLRTHFKDHLGNWYIARVLGRFQVGKFITIEASQPQPSPAPK
jgi:hypothetical protein